jgi:hypothetical protein
MLYAPQVDQFIIETYYTLITWGYLNAAIPRGNSSINGNLKIFINLFHIFELRASRCGINVARWW